MITIKEIKNNINYINECLRRNYVWCELSFSHNENWYRIYDYHKFDDGSIDSHYMNFKTKKEVKTFLKWFYTLIKHI